MIRKTVAGLGAAALLATPVVAVTAAPSFASDREFMCAGAEVDFDVEKDDGRFEVEVDIDDTRSAKWRVQMWHDGNRFHNKVHSTSGDDDDIEIDRLRRDTRGSDTFKLRVKKIGGPKACTVTVRKR
ncbi:MAG: hypothetical protein V9G04_15625 [Nocardioides sp.]|jgi:hypothetical protein